MSTKQYRPLPEPRPIGRRYNSWEGRVILATGRLGTGKTAYAVQRAVKIARKYKLPLYSNAPIRDDAQVLTSWADLAALPLCVDQGITNCVNRCDPRIEDAGCHPAVLLLDEVHLWFPSMAGLMPKDQIQDAMELLSYARKRGWVVIATAQFPTRVHTGFRQLMTEHVKVRKISEGFLHGAALIDPDTNEQIMGWYGFFSPRRARYNTRAEVRPLWRAGRAAPAATRQPSPDVAPLREVVTLGPPPLPPEWRS